MGTGSGVPRAHREWLVVAKRRYLITAHSIPFNCLLNPNQPISSSNYSFIQ